MRALMFAERAMRTQMRAIKMLFVYERHAMLISTDACAIIGSLPIHILLLMPYMMLHYDMFHYYSCLHIFH